MTGPPCEICGKPTESEGRRCCPGIGECFQKLHERDQACRLNAAINKLRMDYAENPYRDNYEEQCKALIRAFEAGRKF